MKITHQTWNNATTSALMSRNLVLLYYTSLPASLAKKLANLYYFRATIKITVVVQGSAQSYGQMVLTFTPQVSIPFEGTVANTLALSQVHNCRIVPHITIDPSKNNTYELQLPVSTPTGWYQVLSDSTNHGSYLYEMQILNPLRSGTAVTSTVNVCVYMSLIDPQFEALTLLTSSGYVDEKVSDVVGSVSYFSALAAPYTGIFEPGIQLFSEVTGVAAKVLRWFGFSKPPQAEIHAVGLNRTCDNYSHVEGISTAMVLGCSQKQSLAIDPQFAGGSMNDMSVSYICSQPALVAADVTITTANTSETSLFNLLVHPLVSYGVNSPSPMAGIAMVSNYWCGDITYTFEFIASVFTRCTVLIAWDPLAISTTIPAFADALAILQNTTVQIVGNTVVDITIPYKHYMPVLSSSIGGIAAGPTLYNSNGINGCSNGMVYVYIVNPVLDNGSTTPTIGVNLWASSKNIVFFGSTTENLILSAVPLTTLTSAGYTDEMATPANISFGPKTELSTLHQRVTGDPIKNVKDITSRMDIAILASTAASAHNSVSVTIPNIPLVTTTSWTTPILTRFGFMSLAFLGYRGSIKYTGFVQQNFTTLETFDGNCRTMANHTIAISNSTPFTTQVLSSPSTQSSSSYAGMAWTQPNLAVSSRNDVTVPMMIGSDFLPVRTFPTAYKDNLIMYFDRSSDQTSSQVEVIAVAQGSGDDGIFMWFLGFPKLN